MCELGRLVLADGLAYADKHLDPDYLVDIATLTGAATLGLGRQYAAMYTRDDELAKELVAIGEESGDKVWHMPLILLISITLQIKANIQQVLSQLHSFSKNS